MLHQQLTQQVIGCFYTVYNTLGYGFLEKVYENSMMFELCSNGLECLQQVPIDVLYRNEHVGDYCCDILVDNKIILELKATKSIAEEHEAQLINYLRATEFEIGLLLNFGKKAEFKRKIFSNHQKVASKNYF